MRGDTVVFSVTDEIRHFSLLIYTESSYIHSRRVAFNTLLYHLRKKNPSHVLDFTTVVFIFLLFFGLARGFMPSASR